MEKGLLFLCALLTCQTVLAADMGNYGLKYLSIDFAAPVVGDRTALTTVSAGQIVYEQGTGFWGLTTSGTPTTGTNWVQLATTQGNSVISSGTERVERATITNSGGSAGITSQSGTWISSVSSAGVNQGTVTVNFSTSPAVFSSAPTCVCVTTWNYGCTILNMPTTSSVTVRTGDLHFSTNDSTVSLICEGPR